MAHFLWFSLDRSALSHLFHPHDLAVTRPKLLSSAQPQRQRAAPTSALTRVACASRNAAALPWIPHLTYACSCMALVHGARASAVDTVPRFLSVGCRLLLSHDRTSAPPFSVALSLPSVRPRPARTRDSGPQTTAPPPAALTAPRPDDASRIFPVLPALGFGYSPRRAGRPIR